MKKYLVTILVFLTATNYCFAAPALVQNTSSYSGASPQTKAFDSDNTAGNVITVCAQDGFNNGNIIDPPPTISDSKGNAYTMIAGPTHGTGFLGTNWVFIANNIAGGANSVTMTRNSAIGTDQGFHIQEWSGLDPTNPFYASSTQVATTTSAYWYVPDLVIGVSSGIILVCGGEELSGGTVTAGTGYTLLNLQAGQESFSEYRTFSSAGTYSASANGYNSGGGEWGLNAIILQAPVAVSTPTRVYGDVWDE